MYLYTCQRSSSKRHEFKPLQKAAFEKSNYRFQNTLLLERSFLFNMALRKNDLEDRKSKDRSSVVSGLNPYWSDPQKKPNVERKSWSDFFAVAMTEEYLIYTTEVLKIIANGTDRNKSLLINLDHPVAE